MLVNLVGEHCQLFAILSASGHAQHHLKQLLAPFAASTLYRYIANCTAFADFVQAAHAPMQQLPVSLVVDFLYACTSSADQDRAVHRTSASSAVKSLRWLAKHIQWAALQACVRNSLVASYCKQIASFDKREATPIPAALVAAWERTLCTPHAPLTTKLVLGAALLCIHSSIRFGDAQRVHWRTLQLSTQGLHAVAYATKTTKAGQPFACTWHGYTGRSAGTSWLLQWLACVSSLPAFQQDASNQPDFLFPHADMQCHTLPYIAPASYARTLLCIRWASQSADICGPAALTPGEAFALTLHSMKSTALASAAQLDLRRDERLAQGHHRDSARLYSRNDTFASLRVQRAIATPWPQVGGLRGPCPEEARRPFPSLRCPSPPRCPQSTSRQATSSQARGRFSHPGMSACKHRTTPNMRQTRLPRRPTLLPLHQTPQCTCSCRLSQMTKKPGKWRNGHSSMHPPTRPPKLQKSNLMSSSSSCVRGHGAACIAPPPKALPHTTPPRQSKASRQSVSLRPRAAQG